MAAFYAAITGDLVKSTRLSPDRLEQARAEIATAVTDLAALYPDAVLGQPDFFRGDAWQLALADPRWALRLSLLVSARLRARLDVSTRIAIGIGGAHIETESVSLSTGEAFILSGRLLDEMSVLYTLAGALPERSGFAGEWFRAMLGLCSGLIRRWKPGQAAVVATALMLPHPTHAQIAQALTPPRRQPTVTAALHGANWRPISDTLDVFESTNWAAVIDGAQSFAKGRTGKQG